MNDVLRNRARLLREEEGLSIRVIAAQLGVSRPAVGEWVHGIGEPRHAFQCQRCGNWNYSARSHARYCCSTGLRTRSTSHRPVDPQRVAERRREAARAWRRRRGARPRMTAREVELVVAMRLADFTLGEIAAHFNRSVAGISRVLERHGVDDLSTDQRFRVRPLTSPRAPLATA